MVGTETETEVELSGQNPPLPPPHGEDDTNPEGVPHDLESSSLSNMSQFSTGLSVSLCSSGVASNAGRLLNQLQVDSDADSAMGDLGMSGG